jgi:flagellar biogenesis protein FliO
VSASQLAPQVTGLPLRHDDPVSSFLMIKVMIILVVILGITYFLLRRYAMAKGLIGRAETKERLACVATLRLSPKTRVYHVQVQGRDFLITEFAVGGTVTPLGPDVPSRLPATQQAENDKA